MEFAAPCYALHSLSFPGISEVPRQTPDLRCPASGFVFAFTTPSLVTRSSMIKSAKIGQVLCIVYQSGKGHFVMGCCCGDNIQKLMHGYDLKEDNLFIRYMKVDLSSALGHCLPNWELSTQNHVKSGCLRIRK